MFGYYVFVLHLLSMIVSHSTVHSHRLCCNISITIPGVFNTYLMHFIHLNHVIHAVSEAAESRNGRWSTKHGWSFFSACRGIGLLWMLVDVFGYFVGLFHKEVPSKLLAFPNTILLYRPTVCCRLVLDYQRGVPTTYTNLGLTVQMLLETGSMWVSLLVLIHRPSPPLRPFRIELHPWGHGGCEGGGSRVAACRRNVGTTSGAFKRIEDEKEEVDTFNTVTPEI